MTSGLMIVPDWYTTFRYRTPALAMGAPPSALQREPRKVVALRYHARIDKA
jgi:hypothetical protein